MALNFKNLKDPKLQPTDKLTFGKFKDCRICDIIQDHYEYLIWAEKQGFVKYSKEVTDLILETASFAAWEPPVEDAKVDDLYDSLKKRSLAILDEDVPF